MKTTLTRGVNPLPNDATIVEEVRRTPPRSQFSGHAMHIGIRGPSGAIYRRFVTDGLPEFMNAIDALQRLGLVGELEESSEMREGCDAIFRVKPLPNDTRIVRKVMSRRTIDAFHGSEDTIGVRGPTGAIYRRFVSEGAPEFVGVDPQSETAGTFSQ